MVFVDGAERNRLLVNVANLTPMAANYQARYNPRDPRYRVQQSRFRTSRPLSLTCLPGTEPS